MSTWMLTREHIHVLVWAGLRPVRSAGYLSWTTDIPDGQERHPDSLEIDAMGMALPYNRFELRPDTANRVGQMLTNTNRDSYNNRYRGSIDSDGRAFRVRAPGEYRYPHGTGPRERGWSPAALFKAIHCYAYQSCGADDWDSSEARAFCEELKERLIGALPGYDEAPWGISISSRAADSKVRA